MMYNGHSTQLRSVSYFSTNTEQTFEEQSFFGGFLVIMVEYCHSLTQQALLSMQQGLLRMP